MLIMPTATPLALTDLQHDNQTQHQQLQNAELSRKNSDTVQLSAQARELAGGGLRQQGDGDHANLTVTHAAADREATEAVADNETAEQQRLDNPLTRMPETTKIDILA